MPPNRDDRLADIGEKVPGFRGMCLNPTDIEVLNIFLLEPNNSSHVAAVKGAIKEVFPGAIPSGGIQPAQGQYRILDLYQWHNEVVAAISKSDWARDGMSFSDI